MDCESLKNVVSLDPRKRQNIWQSQITIKRCTRKTKATVWGSRALKVAFSLCFLFILLSFSIFVFYAKDLPRPEKFTERRIAETTQIYDRTGTVLLYELSGEERREIVPLEDVS